MDRQDLVTVNEAAALLGVSVRTVHRLTRQRSWQVYRRPGDSRNYLARADVLSVQGFQPVPTRKRASRTKQEDEPNGS